MLPFLDDLGYKVPPFDFRVPGVTSISLDAHKYGYAPKGTSVILYRHRGHRRKQFYIDTEWPGGIFASTTFMGTKCGGPLAGAWAIMNHIGREGYRKLAGEVMETALKIRKGIESIDGLQILGDPGMTLLAFTSRNGDIFNIGEALSRKGWYLDRLQFPEGLHMTINRLNVGMEEEFLKDLGEIVRERESLRADSRATRNSVRIVGGLTGILPARIFEGLTRRVARQMTCSPDGKADRRSGTASQAALYGIHATLDNRKNVKKLVENLIDGIYS
jgi:sphinganine-1-phosphate aldolase